MSLQRLYLSLVWGVLACQPSQPAYTTLEGQAQGTTFRIVYAASDDLAPAIDSLFRIINRSMSLWDSASLISRTARRALSDRL